MEEAVGTTPSGDEVGVAVPSVGEASETVVLETETRLVAWLVTWGTVVTALLGVPTSMGIVGRVGTTTGVVVTSGTLTTGVDTTGTRVVDGQLVVVMVFPGQLVTLGGHEVTVTVKL